MTQVYFENIENYISLLLSGAKQRIYIAVAWFTNQELFDGIVKAAERNVNIKLLLLDDILNRNEFGLDFGILIEKGGDIRFANDKSGTMHHKFCIIDDKVITGSYNWTYHANKNDENIVVIDEESIVNKYCEQFDLLFKRYNTITLPYEHLKWTEIKEGDFTEFRRDIFRDIVAKNDVYKELKKNKLLKLNNAYKSDNEEELLNASSFPIEKHLRTITEVLTHKSQNYSLMLWEENPGKSPIENTAGYTNMGKWFFVPYTLGFDKNNQECVSGSLKPNSCRDVFISPGLPLKIYDKEFITTMKEVTGRGSFSFFDDKKCIPDSVLCINYAKMFFYPFPSPMFNMSQKKEWQNGSPRTISAINVLGIAKEVNNDNVIFYEGWEPNKRGIMIMNRFFVKQ